MRYFLAIIATVLLFTAGLSAQNGLPETGIKDNLVIGTVRTAGSEKLVLDTKDGSIDAVILSMTAFKRLAPDNLSMSAAVDAALTDITAGDRVVVTGKVSDDKKSIYSTKVFVVKGSDLEAQAAKVRADWQNRGISGKVAALNPEAKTITIKFSSIVGTESVVTVTPKNDVIFKRYSKTSARYSDAQESSYSIITVGDNLQALGDKSEDGAAFAAEEILTGSFVTVGGTIKSIDAAKNEVTISDIMTGAEVTVVVVDTSMVKRFPEDIAQRLAGFQAMAASGAMPAGAGGGARSGGGARPGGAGQGQGGGGRGMGDINDMINRFPSIGVSELKVGEVIAVSSSKPDDPKHVTAIKLLAGVGPFLSSMSSGGQRRGRGVSGSLNVPGLDSFDF